MNNLGERPVCDFSENRTLVGIIHGHTLTRSVSFEVALFMSHEVAEEFSRG